MKSNITYRLLSEKYKSVLEDQSITTADMALVYRLKNDLMCDRVFRKLLSSKNQYKKMVGTAKYASQKHRRIPDRIIDYFIQSLINGANKASMSQCQSDTTPDNPTLLKRIVRSIL